MIHVLYNALAGNRTCGEQAQKLHSLYKGEDIVFRSMGDLDYAEYLPSLGADDKVIICGGDGTLNRFVNETRGIEIKNDILYYAAGSGNDFLHDLGKEKGEPPFAINDYINNLPSVTVKGKERFFMNAVGFGIDGYCCEEGDKLREKQSGKPVNYTAIAIKGLLGAFKPANAEIIVDGVKKTYKKVWIAPAMNGRYYGGGMIAAPAQDRNADDGKLSLVVWHGSNKLKTLVVFPSIFKGEHIKHSECIDIIKVDSATVKFSRPCALQIDGETVLDVTEYSVKSAALVKREKQAQTV